MWRLIEKTPEKAREQREVFRDTLIDLMDSDEKIVMLEADLGGASGSLKIGRAHPERYFECGVMEANMVGVASGMSMRGFKPFLHTFAPFASRRVADQVFLEGAYAGNTLNIYASDPGVCAATNGGTHTTFEDISLMRAIPEVMVFDPADGVQLEWLLRTLAGMSGVHYIRTTRKDILPVYAPGSSFEIGRGNILRRGSEVLIIAMGQILEDALSAAEQLESGGVSAEVIDMFTVKPLDRALIISEAEGKRLVVTCENHSIYGGLGSCVAEVLSELPAHAPLCRVGVADRFGQVGSLNYLKKDYGLDAGAIVSRIRERLQNGR
ncbi:MAG: transketolase family protein [Fretibacterium sp.]|nr:transketolase family protein [Fretibacterium sp.]